MGTLYTNYLMGVIIASIIYAYTIMISETSILNISLLTPSEQSEVSVKVVDRLSSALVRLNQVMKILVV